MTQRALLNALLIAFTLSGVVQAQSSHTDREPDTFSFAPAFRAEGFDDFSVGFALRGVTSEGSRVTSRLSAGPNPENQLVSATLSYERPLTLVGAPAALRVGASSDFTQGHPLASGEGRTYTQRLTGLSVGLEQSLSVFTLGLVGRIVGAEAFLENADEMADGVALLSDDFSGVFGASFRYNSELGGELSGERGDPRSGGAAALTLGYGLGERYGRGADEQLSWAQADLALRGYVGVSGRGISLQDAPRFVLAARLNAGANVGDAPLWRRLSPSLRGYDDFALVGERTFDLSADVRYHTGLSAPFGSGFGLSALIPYLFTDAGDAWGGDAARRYRAPKLEGGVQRSYGAGAQFGLETPFAALPLNLWYARGAQGGALGFEVGFLY